MIRRELFFTLRSLAWFFSGRGLPLPAPKDPVQHFKMVRRAVWTFWSVCAPIVFTAVAYTCSIAIERGIAVTVTIVPFLAANAILSRRDWLAARKTAEDHLIQDVLGS